MELKDLKPENEGLLDSFESPLDDNQSIESESSDKRLHNLEHVMTSTSAGEIDRSIHNAIRTEQSGSSRQSRHDSDNEHNYDNFQDAYDHNDDLNDNFHDNIPSGSNSADLESQTPTIRLTKTQRVMNVLHHLVPIKQTYERINNGLVTGRMQPNVPGRFIGQGTDGVFRNLMAKPDTNSNVVKNETNPPTYEEAAADATPEYWETSVIAPIYEDEVFVEGLPVGNVANFVWNGLVTVAFQFVGFLLCYLLHTSHAAKHGSRAGLGITFIFYGWNLVPSNFGSADELPDKYEPKNPNNYDIDQNTAIDDAGIDDYTSNLFKANTEDTISNTPYFAYGLIAFGLLMICKALVDYYRVKQMERVILHPPNNNNTNNVNMFEDQENIFMTGQEHLSNQDNDRNDRNDSNETDPQENHETNDNHDSQDNANQETNTNQANENQENVSHRIANWFFR